MNKKLMGCIYLLVNGKKIPFNQYVSSYSFNTYSYKTPKQMKLAKKSTLSILSKY